MSRLVGFEGQELLRWEPHPEVWILVVSVVVLGIYVARVIGPKVVPPSEKPVHASQISWFVTGLVLMWVASDWPVHDVAEQNLYTFHMLQHVILALMVPPAFWLATPEWLAHLVIRNGSRAYAGLRMVANPVVAGVIFNVVILTVHWPVVVNTSVRVAPFHYSVHVAIVLASFLMWMPVFGPWKELRLSPPGQMVYLFLMTVVPTIPAAWLGLASQPVYEAYDHHRQLFGLSVIQDQGMAGVLMKAGGDLYMWAVIFVLFVRWAADHERENREARLVVDPETMQPVPRENCTRRPDRSSAGGSRGAGQSMAGRRRVYSQRNDLPAINGADTAQTSNTSHEPASAVDPSSVEACITAERAPLGSKAATEETGPGSLSNGKIIPPSNNRTR